MDTQIVNNNKIILHYNMDKSSVWFKYNSIKISGIKYTSENNKIMINTKFVYTNPMGDGVHVTTFNTENKQIIPFYTQENNNQECIWYSPKPIFKLNKFHYIDGCEIIYKKPEFVVEVCIYNV